MIGGAQMAAKSPKIAAAWTAGLILALAWSGVAASAPTVPTVAAVNARKANFKEIGGAFKTINDEVKSGSPDMNSVRPAAKDLASRAAQQVKFFPRGSGPQPGLKTRAKAEIWSQMAVFTRLQSEMTAAASALNSAAQANDLAGMTRARASLGETCKSCHDRFRESD